MQDVDFLKRNTTDRAMSRSSEKHDQGKLSRQAFSQVVAWTPLVAVDFLIRRAGTESFLLGLRTNPPAQDTWCVPGGRVRKNESIHAAVARKLSEELGIDRIPDLDYRGVYEHFYSDSMFSPRTSTHYVAIAYGFEIDDSWSIRAADNQHEEFRFFPLAEILTSDAIAPQIKQYFANAPDGRVDIAGVTNNEH